MAKKSRRPKDIRLTPAQMVRPGADDLDVTTVEEESTNLREEYRYVIADLRRIGLIAVAMLVALIVLAMMLT